MQQKQLSFEMFHNAPAITITPVTFRVGVRGSTYLGTVEACEFEDFGSNIVELADNYFVEN